VFVFDKAGLFCEHRCYFSKLCLAFFEITACIALKVYGRFAYLLLYLLGKITSKKAKKIRF